MKLILGDLHLLNEANDKYSKTLFNISEALRCFGILDRIDNVDLVGDIFDCEYVTFKRIAYFSTAMDVINTLFSQNKKVLIGNHDKYFKNDQHSENVIRYIKFDGDIIDSPIIIDRILYIPHYYEKDNFPISLLNEDDFDIIIGHLGLEFSENVEELTINHIRSYFKKKIIISGHIHNMDLDFDSKKFFLGSIKSESWKEQSPVFAVAVLDKLSPMFLVFPYYKPHLKFNIYSEDLFRDELLDVFRKIHFHNLYYTLYDINGDLINKNTCNKYITSGIELKLIVYDKSIKKKDIDLIIDYCKHEINDPAFTSINIKTLYKIDTNGDTNDSDQKVSDEDAKINEKLYLENKSKLYKFFDDIKNGKILLQLGSNKKFSKLLDGVSEEEIDRFTEFVIASKNHDDLKELLNMIK